MIDFPRPDSFPSAGHRASEKFAGHRAPKKPPVDYIGWCGHGNLGDELCLEVVRSWLPGYDVHPTERPRAALCLIGGGTLIGGTRETDRYRQLALAALSRGATLAVCGTGFDLQTPLAVWPEPLRACWGHLLQRARLVGLRGPLSIEAAQTLGCNDPHEIGDPVLSIDHPTVQPMERFVLLNAGSEREPPGGREPLLLRLGAIVGWLHGEGYQVAYLPLRPSDVDQARLLIAAYDLPVAPCNGPDAIKYVAASAAVVSLRLHGAVLAAACGVPFVSLAYHAKHWDFHRSMATEGDCSPLCISPATNLTYLADSILCMLRAREAISQEMAARVVAYRARQRMFAVCLQQLAKEVY